MKIYDKFFRVTHDSERQSLSLETSETDIFWDLKEHLLKHGFFYYHWFFRNVSESLI